MPARSPRRYLVSGGWSLQGYQRTVCKQLCWCSLAWLCMKWFFLHLNLIKQIVLSLKRFNLLRVCRFSFHLHFVCSCDRELPDWHWAWLQCNILEGIPGSWCSCGCSVTHKTHPNQLKPTHANSTPQWHPKICTWMLNQMWIWGILRPVGDLKAFVVFLRWSFGGMRANVVLLCHQECVCKVVWAECQVVSTWVLE